MEYIDQNPKSQRLVWCIRNHEIKQFVLNSEILR